MVKVLLVDDHRMLRGLLRSLIEEQAGLEVAGEADNGLIGLDLARQLQPDVVVTDLNMTGMDGLELARELCHFSRPVGVVILTMFREPAYVDQAMEAGARGYVLKGGDFEEVVQAIRAVASGRRYISPSLALEDSSRPQ